MHVSAERVQEGGLECNLGFVGRSVSPSPSGEIQSRVCVPFSPASGRVVCGDGGQPICTGVLLL